MGNAESTSVIHVTVEATTAAPTAMAPPVDKSLISLIKATCLGRMEFELFLQPVFSVSAGVIDPFR